MTDAEPVTTSTKEHGTATAEHTATVSAAKADAVEKVTVRAEEPEAEVTQAVTDEPVASAAAGKSVATATAVGAVAVARSVELAVTADGPENTADPAPTMAVAALSTATTTTTSTNWLADLFNSFVLS